MPVFCIHVLYAHTLKQKTQPQYKALLSYCCLVSDSKKFNAHCIGRNCKSTKFSNHNPIKG